MTIDSELAAQCFETTVSRLASVMGPKDIAVGLMNCMLSVICVASQGNEAESFELMVKTMRQALPEARDRVLASRTEGAA